MSLLLNIALGINLFLFLMAIANSLTMVRPPKVGSDHLSFSLLIPCRNEEENVLALVESLAATEHPHCEVIFINDNSTDRTHELLLNATADYPAMSVINAEPLPQGWLGKPWALAHGVKQAKNEFLVTIDADVRLTPDAISTIDLLLKRTGVDFLSPYPAQIALTLSERLIQPLLQWTWMTTVPLRLAMKSTRPSLAVANGQFFFIRKSSLVQAGGFETIKSSVLDDIDLARLLVRNGFHGGVCDGSTVASTRMYSNFSEIRAGYGKSLSQGFGGIAGSLAIATVMAISGLLPFIFAMTGSTAATIAFLLVIASRLVSAFSSRSLLIDALLHPISTVVFIYLLLYSNLYRKQIRWKGRSL
jgi:cellulose synthase/poly-beta-1,6-N-acetylglucosamine synthase-like glycosyltransferase